MRKYFEKGKMWIKTHKRSRGHATSQNLCIATFLIVLCVILIRGYAADNSLEAVTEAWCKDNLFGEAEVLATITYTDSYPKEKTVIIGKEMPNGERYEAELTMLRKNPLKWENIGCSYSTVEIDYMVDESGIEDWGNDIYRFSAKEVSNMFTEFYDVAWVDVAYVYTQVMEGMEPGPESHMSLLVRIQYTETEAGMNNQWEIAEISYYVNLETMEVEQTRFQPIQFDGKDAELWMSEERMVFVAEKLMGNLEK